MFTRQAFDKIIGKYLFAAIILGAIGTELYAQQNQDGSLNTIDAFDQTRSISIGDIRDFVLSIKELTIASGFLDWRSDFDEIRIFWLNH